MLISITTEPSLIPSIIPAGPVITASTCGESGTIVMMMSDLDAVSDAETEGDAPNRSALPINPSSRSKTVTG